MKFASDDDKVIFDIELRESNLGESDFIKRRTQIVTGIRDFQRGQQTKSQWRKNKYKMLKGMRRYHKSTAGKKFHRQLSRYMTSRTFGGLAYDANNEAIKALSSALTHGMIETQYFMPVMECVEYEIFLDCLTEFVAQATNDLRQDKGIQDEEFLIRLIETAEIVKSFADQSGKTVAEVEDLWNRAKKIVTDEYNLTEEDDEFYKYVVGVLKKMLGLGSKE